MIEPALAHDHALPHVTSVNVGGVREIAWHGEIVRTGIWKSPIGDRPVAVRGVNLDGDDQGDRTVHGGPDKAVYAYAVEDYAYWRDVEELSVEPALFGENLTVVGMDLTAAVIGERWRVGSVLLEVAQPRLPCYKLGIRMGDARFPKRFLAAGRLGAYLRIIEAGELRRGDAVQLVSRPDHGVTLGLMGASVRDPALRAHLQRAPQLPPHWREG